MASYLPSLVAVSSSKDYTQWEGQHFLRILHPHGSFPPITALPTSVPTVQMLKASSNKGTVCLICLTVHGEASDRLFTDLASPGW